MSERKKLVVIGNGMASVRTLEELLKIAPEKYQISVYGDEPYGCYNRIMLSPVLADEARFDEIITHDLGWYKERNINLLSNRRIVKIDRVKQQVFCASGEVEHYDRLLIATGSKPFVLPLAGNRLKGVVSYRDIEDVEKMQAVALNQDAKNSNHAVVIGGGLLGLEAAYGLKKQGMDVTVVHRSAYLLGQQLDAQAAQLLVQHLGALGIYILLDTQTQALQANGEDSEQLSHIILSNKQNQQQRLAVDLVVMAAGIRPNIALAQSSGIKTEKGILVDDTLQTFDPKIYAVGECVQHRGTSYGLVAPLYEQAYVCANHLAEFGAVAYKGSLLSTKLKVTGVNLFSAGDYLAQTSGCEVLFYQDLSNACYKKIVLKDQKIIGVVLYGDAKDGAWYYQLLSAKTNISAWRSVLIFGQAFIDPLDDARDAKPKELAYSAA